MCDFVQRDGFVFCWLCCRTVVTNYPPERVQATCKGGGAVQANKCGGCGAAPKPAQQLTPREIAELLPEESDPTLIGNRIKALTTALGIPPCNSCSARAAWLNQAHQWLRQQFSPPAALDAR